MPEGATVAAWLVAFGCTCAIEVPVYVALLRRQVGGSGRLLLLGFGLQLVTHPALWFLFPHFAPHWLSVLVAEAGVVAAEASLATWALRPEVSARRVCAVALVANCASTAAGLWLL